MDFEMPWKNDRKPDSPDVNSQMNSYRSGERRNQSGDDEVENSDHTRLPILKEGQLSANLSEDVNSQSQKEAAVWTRRSAMKAGALTTALLSSLPFAANARNIEYIEIPFEMSDGEPISTKEVPKKWHNNVLKARDIQRRILSEYKNDKAVLSVARTNTREQIGDLYKKKIIVRCKNENDFNFQSYINDIPIEIQELSSESDIIEYEYKKRKENKTEVSDTSADYNVNNSSNCTDSCQCLKGGSKIYDDHDDHFYSGTICCPAEYENDIGILTATHLFTDDYCNVDTDWKYVCDGDEVIGNITEYELVEDWAFIPKASFSDVDISNQLLPFYDEITGYMSEGGVDWLESSDETIHMHGQTNCSITGKVTEVDEKWRSVGQDCSEKITIVDTDVSSDDGDSGAPIYHRNTHFDTASIITLNFGGGNGYPAYKIANDGINFGISNPDC